LEEAVIAVLLRTDISHNAKLFWGHLLLLDRRYEHAALLREIARRAGWLNNRRDPIQVARRALRELIAAGLVSKAWDIVLPNGRLLTAEQAALKPPPTGNQKMTSGDQNMIACDQQITAGDQKMISRDQNMISCDNQILSAEDQIMIIRSQNNQCDQKLIEPCCCGSCGGVDGYHYSGGDLGDSSRAHARAPVSLSLSSRGDEIPSEEKKRKSGHVWQGAPPIQVALPVPEEDAGITPRDPEDLDAVSRAVSLLRTRLETDALSFEVGRMHGIPPRRAIPGRRIYAAALRLLGSDLSRMRWSHIRNRFWAIARDIDDAEAEETIREATAEPPPPASESPAEPAVALLTDDEIAALPAEFKARFPARFLYGRHFAEAFRAAGGDWRRVDLSQTGDVI
jgi:hypothetical protein